MTSNQFILPSIDLVQCWINKDRGSAEP